MQQRTLKSLYDLHSWIGVVVGLVLYVVCVSGVVALFAQELEPWARKDLRPPVTDAGPALDGAVAQTIKAMREGGATAAGLRFTVDLPTRYRPTVSVQYRAGPARTERTLTVDAPSRAEVPVPAESPNAMLTRLHTDLLLPSPYGRYVVGAFGLVMLISVITGTLLHRKMLADLFTLRAGRSLRLFWTDLHKSVGLWGLPFHFMLALTGAILGFSGPAVRIAAYLAFGGDAGAVSAAMFGSSPPPLGIAATMLPPSVLLARAVEALPGFVPEMLLAFNYGDAHGVIEFLGNRPGALVYYLSVVVDGATGEIVRITDWSEEGFGRRIYAMVTPLHYASYGGIALKVLYAVLGTGTCLVIVAGLNLWLARPADASTLSRRILPKLTSGVFYGFPAATAVIFWLHHLVPGLPIVAVFLAMCALAAAWPWLRGRERGACDLLGLTGVLLATLPLFTLLASGRASSAYASPPVLVTEVAALCLGAGLVYAAVRRRPVEAR